MADKKGAKGRRTGKYAGTVVLTPPGGARDEAVSNGTRIVVSIAELVFGRLPEAGDRSEVQCDVAVRTTAQNGTAVAATWSSGVHYYVPHDSRLNISRVVVFDGLVHQHLSFDFSVVERESPQLGLENAAELAESAAEAAATLASAAGNLGTVLGAFESVVGGILRLGGDDQVLRHATSLFTREVERPESGSGYLVEGRYRVEKRRRAGEGEPEVTLVLDVNRSG